MSTKIYKYEIITTIVNRKVVEAENIMQAMKIAAWVDGKNQIVDHDWNCLNEEEVDGFDCLNQKKENDQSNK